MRSRLCFLPPLPALWRSPELGAGRIWFTLALAGARWPAGSWTHSCRCKTPEGRAVFLLPLCRRSHLKGCCGCANPTENHPNELVLFVCCLGLLSQGKTLVVKMGKNLTSPSFGDLFRGEAGFDGSAGLQRPCSSWGRTQGFPWLEGGPLAEVPAVLPCHSRCQILAASVPTRFSPLPFCLPGHAGRFLLVSPGPSYRHGRGVRQLRSLCFLPGGRGLCSGSSFRVLR